jgi:glutamyl-tRNA synthetase
MNGIYIREKMSADELYKYSRGDNFFNTNFWPTEAEDYDDNYRQKVLGIVKERLKYFAELPELTSFFFKDLSVNPDLITSHKQLKKLKNDELRNLLETTQASLQKSDFTSEDLTAKLNELLESTGQKPATLFSLVRIAVTQAPASPGLADTLEVLGRELSLARIAKQIKDL